MNNDDLHLDSRVQQARMSVARQLFAHQVDYLKATAAVAPASDNSTMPTAEASANDDERTRAIDHASDLLAARPRYTSRRGHYLPYGLRAAG